MNFLLVATVTALQSASEAPTLKELENATYVGLESSGGRVTLVDGRWEGPIAPGAASRPMVQMAGDFRVVGDVDGDGTDEAAVLLAESSGGTGSCVYLAVVARRNEAIVNVATTRLGDRVQIRGVRIEDARIYVDAVRAGAQDAMCCPGDLVTLGFRLENDSLQPIDVSTELGRLTLDVIGGAEWVLRFWDIGVRAPALVTLRFEGGRFAGSTGCNRYFASVTPGKIPGDITVGPANMTRMACPDPAASTESQFLQALGSVTKFGFFLGRLALTYEKDSDVRTMLFDKRPEH